MAVQAFLQIRPPKEMIALQQTCRAVLILCMAVCTCHALSSLAGPRSYTASSSPPTHSRRCAPKHMHLPPGEAGIGAEPAAPLVGLRLTCSQSCDSCSTGSYVAEPADASATTNACMRELQSLLPAWELSCRWQGCRCSSEPSLTLLDCNGSQ